ncbi:MAG: hypothetical protein JST92_06855 [Deltaproteobacteria bacterium]|nr:hypothetical protein [Deltaproteobacteria bacterium]
MSTPSRPRSPLLLATLAISVALFAACLTQKCYCSGNNGCGDSLAVLLTGGLGILAEFGTLSDHGLQYPVGATFTWLANPLLVLAWFFALRDRKVALGLAVAASALSSSFLLFKHVIGSNAGQYTDIIGYAAGYWLWVASACVLALGLAVDTLRSRAPAQAPRGA